MDIYLDESWKKELTHEFSQPYFTELTHFIQTAYQNDTVYPQQKHIFRALDVVPLPKVRVVIVGQDPYHGPRQANGLSFSVEKGMPLPPSLRNIFKEIANEYNTTPSTNGDLSRFAKQGVLLLNATLTVSAQQPGSHQGKGWEYFTDAVLTAISNKNKHVVFMLWGAYARKKGAYIDRTKHLVLESSHPSPLSAHNGFFGNNHFKKTNTYLETYGQKPINWVS